MKTDEERFFEKVIYSDHCWEWQNCSSRGYGFFYSNEIGKTVRAHRWSYEYFIGPLGSALCCHHCDKPDCVNPFHLFAGTQSENMRDCVAKGRLNRQNITHCKKGHLLSGENLRLRKNGQRTCIKCKRESNKMWQKILKEKQQRSPSVFNHKAEG